MRAIRSYITRFNFILAVAGAYVVFIIMFVMTGDVIARFFKIPVPGAVELTEIALALMVFLGWAYTQEQKAHIAIDIVYKRLPIGLQRALDLINPILGMILMAIIAWRGWGFALYSRSGGETTENLSWPVWPFKLVLVLGAFCFCLQLIMDICHVIRGMRKK